MKSANRFSQLSFFVLFLSTFSWAAASCYNSQQNFLQCLTRYSHDSSISQVIYTPKNSYAETLLSSANNMRFAKLETPKPLVIVTPVSASQIRIVIYCSKKNDLKIKIRSGGHSFEGISYVSEVPFVLLDIVNLRSFSFDSKSKTAWIESDLTNGEPYYKIGQATKTLGFPSSLWANVGIEGIISGGGYGMMRRKYGLTADNVIDAQLIDVYGRILDRKSKGEDLSWAIRGRGGGSFGVVLSWKVKLVPVPKIVTIFRVKRTLEQNLTNTFNLWQSVAPKFPKELDIRCSGQSILSDASPRDDKRTMEMLFESLYLGRKYKLLSVMQERFPELGLVGEDCLEVSWIQAMMFFSNFEMDMPPEILLNRTILPRPSFKGRSDFTEVPISEEGLNGLWEMMYKIEPQAPTLQFTPYGGRMNEISKSALPFPYRAGTLYMMNMYAVTDVNEAERIEWVRSLGRYLTSYVTKSLRSAYVNYVNLWMGINNPQGRTNYQQARKWGKRYFKNNFDRLVKVKSKIDPDNFFRHEQILTACGMQLDCCFLT